MSHSTDIVSVIDGSGTIQYKSPAIEEQLRYDRYDLIGDRAFEYVHYDDMETVERALKPVFEGEAYRSDPYEYRFRHADGSWLWFESILTDCTDTSLDSYVVNSRDITDRKQQEKELRRERDRLDEFASVVSHDLRNPLNVALGRLKLAHDECSSAHLEEVSNALDRMDALIRDILALAREGDSVSSPEAVDLANMAESCWQNVKTAEPTLVTKSDRTIQADPTRLQQLLENLLRDAIEHGGEDVTVTVGAIDSDSGAGFYAVDDGPASPQTDASKPSTADTLPRTRGPASASRSSNRSSRHTAGRSA